MSMDKSILTNIAYCYQNSNPSQTFLWGKFEEIVTGGVAFWYKTRIKSTDHNSTKLRHRWFHEGVLK